MNVWVKESPCQLREKELYLGYEAGSTAAPGLSQRARHEVTSRCIDANAAEHLMAWICALYSCGDDALHKVAGMSAMPSWGPQLTAWASRSELMQHYSLPAVSMLEKSGWKVGGPLGSPDSGHLCYPVDFASFSRSSWPPDRRGLGFPSSAGPIVPQPVLIHMISPDPYTSPVRHASTRPVAAIAGAVSADVDGQIQQQATAQGAEIQEPRPTNVSGSKDVWRDPNAIGWLMFGSLPSDSPSTEHARIKRRCKGYVNQSGRLYRVMADSSHKEVPPPDARAQIILTTHKQTGHLLWPEAHPGTPPQQLLVGRHGPGCGSRPEQL
jgi:hypothetical protein